MNTPTESNPLSWQALNEARRQVRPRRPFVVDNERVGSVDEAHLSALQPWGRWLELRAQAVVLTAAPSERDAVFSEMNHRLREQGLIRAWRDEPFPLLCPRTGAVRAVFERASARFWGTLTLGAHCNGWVADEDGKPARMWIARRSLTKATDPGLLDNLIGGGVPHGQTPDETLVREGFEEAGLSPAQMARAVPGRVIELDRDIPEGRQFERLHVFDLQLQPGERPVNQDGEVGEVQLWAMSEVVRQAASAQMTVDASLVTLDFLVRHGQASPSWASGLQTLVV
jgi:8-oxo-dGTP pyrophosphatase MutT (NUDIX family)